MLTSMTGFGRAEVSVPPAGRAVAEVRTLNHKYLEVECRLPESFQAFEEDVRRAVASNIRRGQVRVSVAWATAQGEPPPAVFHAGLARRYAGQLRRLQRRLGLRGAIRLETILALPQVITVAQRRHADFRRSWPAMRAGLGKALAAAVRMRRQEGARLGKALRAILQKLETGVRRIRKQAPQIERRMQEKLAERIEGLLRSAGERPAGADRAAVRAEAADIVQASDVREELDRMESHLEALRRVVSGKPAGSSAADPQASPGRTMDFLAQEMQREVNTLGTKLRESSVVRGVVTLKGQIEKLREQAANIE